MEVEGRLYGGRNHVVQTASCCSLPCYSEIEVWHHLELGASNLEAET